MSSITTLHPSHNTPPSPTKRHNHSGIDVSHKYIYGDVLKRMIAYLDCYHVNLLGQLNHTWKKCIFSDKKKVPWITKDVSLLIENYTRQILFDTNNQLALIKNEQYLLLLKIEQTIENVQIFPSSYIHRFCDQRLLLERVLRMPNLQELKIKGEVDFADFINIKHSNFTALKSLEFKYCSQVTDEDLGHLNRLTTLEILRLSNCSRITQIDLTSLTGLKTFYLDKGPHVTYINLETCIKLQNLNIIDCPQVIDNSFHCSKLSQLKNLNLYNTSIGNATLFALKNFTKLQSLTLSKCSQITDIGISYLKECKALHALFLNACSNLTNQALGYISHLSALTTLDLSKCTQISDEGLTLLQGLTELDWLDLSNCPITDTGLSYLTALPALRSLCLRKCSQVTNTGFIHLKALTALHSLVLTECPKIDDAIIPHLIMCTTLKSFFHKRLQITDDGLRFLQKQLPELTIYPAPLQVLP